MLEFALRFGWKLRDVLQLQTGAELPPFVGSLCPGIAFTLPVKVFAFEILERISCCSYYVTIFKIILL